MIRFGDTKPIAWIFNIGNRAGAEIGGVMGKQLEGFALDVGEERNGKVIPLELTPPG